MWGWCLAFQRQAAALTRSATRSFAAARLTTPRWMCGMQLWRWSGATARCGAAASRGYCRCTFGLAKCMVQDAVVEFEQRYGKVRLQQLAGRRNGSLQEMGVRPDVAGVPVQYNMLLVAQSRHTSITSYGRVRQRLAGRNDCSLWGSREQRSRRLWVCQCVAAPVRACGG